MATIKNSLTERQDVLDQIRQNPDVSVLIVGGGINGAGLLRDLALQGIDVLLVDKSDFCTGASAASSRMIHGGLRYLEFGEFRLVSESLKDRNLLLQNAAHYVKPLPTTIPIFSWCSGAVSCIRRFLHLGGTRPAHRGAVMVKIGLTFYDIFTRKHRVTPRHKFTSREEALARRPHLHPDLIRTATYYDAWISYPERLCLELLLDAEQLCDDARAVNYLSLRSGSDEGGSDETVTLRDELSGEILTVKPRVVVNATGGWIDFANRALGYETRMIGGTKGAHLVVDNDELFKTLDGEMIYYETPDGRVSVVLPWLGKALVGSTDIRCGNPDDVRCEEDEVDYMLGSLREVLPNLQIKRSQIVSRFSGVRPLRRSEGATVQASRDHLCSVLDPSDKVRFPVYNLIGGKWTTFRAFAEQVTDRILAQLDLHRRRDTEDLAIGGGKEFPRSEQARSQWLARLHDQTKLPEARLGDLLDRYGTRAEQVALFLTEQEDRPLTHLAEYSRREIEFLVRSERVIHLDDLLLRRTAIALLGQLTGELFGELVEIIRALQQWSEDETRNEIERTLALLEDRHKISIAYQP